MARTQKTRKLSRSDFLKLSGAGLTGAALFGVAGCGGGGTISGGGGGSGGSTFVFGRGADSISLDPIHATDGESFRATRQIFDTLLDFAPESFDMIPALATEVPKAQDGGLSYTLKLRKGVKFHDGTDFNAEAVRFNFDRWRDTKNEYHKGGGGQSSDFAYYLAQFGGFDDDSVIESVDVIDDYTVKFSLKEPQGPFTRNLTMSPFGIASPAAIKKNVDDFWQEPVGTGPYTFSKWERNSQIRVEANKDWWGTDLPASQGYGGPHLKEVIIRSIPDNTQRVAALTGNQLNGADGLVPDDVPTVKQQEGFALEFRPPNTVGYLAMNNEKEPFDDPKVRQAFNYAIDMPKLVEAVLGETGEVASNYMPPLIPFFNNSIEPYPYDPDKAKQLLAEAGVENLETELWYMPIPRPYMPDAKSVAQIMQQDLKDVGVNAKLVTYEWGTYLDKTGKGDHTMCLLGWTGDNGDADNFLNVLLNSASATPSAASNVAYYKNPEVDKLLEKAQTTVNESARQDAYYRAQEIMHEDAPWVPIAYVKPPIGLQDAVKNFDPNPTSSESFNPVTLSGGK
ncbi:MAG: Dipeptide-binding ABC transporter, periplasmic substrate-binding component [uncultured Rubrobacteraceae bacterium]|uniref:Dipeptide-binding ABC transporter, periplasmic substrate-binding component n=1 Tax=uncultured Rubrobacteraceae bacterium TaxID=349277 RepID=A0A6J4RD75_9ACTN|nr:MAG: Dipeptide-binding ABC transporter, periplasmic substrate-binding component [uncultured Rubrobacteraceae bacterium]